MSAISTAELNFVQISDSHIGFNKPANTDVVGTTREAIMRINALPKTPEFLLHTGDLTHLTEPEQFDTLAQLLKECRTKDVFYVPGEHDFYDNGEEYRERFGKNTTGAGWHSFDQKGVHSPGWSTLQIFRRVAWVLLARNNSTGLKKTSKACRPVRRLSCSRIFHCGLSILNGVGEPMTPSEHSLLLSVSGP